MRSAHEERIHQLRRRAALYRKAALVKTTGGHLDDKELLALAERYEYEADQLERGEP